MKNDSKTRLISLIIMALSLCFVPAFAHTQTDSLLTLAKQYQTGMYRDVDAQKAYQIYSELAREKSPQALVELGNMYLRGEGTAQNYGQAFTCFREAAGFGYAPAMCRLALRYQKGIDTLQDFAKAFALYDRAANQDDPDGCYGAGYLTYKGFGVKQNYAKALEYFQKGAGKNDSRCEFMLGCHELMGYDNNQNIEKAKQYMEKAMAHGHRWVEDVIKYNMVDSLTRDYKRTPDRWTDVKNGRISHTKRTVANSASAGQLSGSWNGKVYTYEWAGKKIVSEESIQLKITGNNDHLALQWFSNDTLRATFYAQKMGDEWVPLQGAHCNPSSKTRWYIAHSRYDIETKSGKEVLYVDADTYNMDMREPQMPQLAVLEREASSPL